MREFFHLSLWARRREPETVIRAWDESLVALRSRRLVLRQLSKKEACPAADGPAAPESQGGAGQQDRGAAGSATV